MQYTICNINAFDNGYLESDLFTNFNKFCIKRMEEIASLYNMKYKMFDYNDEIVKEAKKEIDKKNFQINNRNILFYIDCIRFYILSKIPNLIFLDDDIIIYDKKDFIFSVLKSKMDNQPLFLNLGGFVNNSCLDIFKQLFYYKCDHLTEYDCNTYKKNNLNRFKKINGVCHLWLTQQFIKIIECETKNDFKKEKYTIYLLNKNIHLCKEERSSSFFKVVPFFKFDKEIKNDFYKVIKEEIC